MYNPYHYSDEPTIPADPGTAEQQQRSITKSNQQGSSLKQFVVHYGRFEFQQVLFVLGIIFGSL